jgi:hypothetical protein
MDFIMLRLLILITSITILFSAPALAQQLSKTPSVLNVHPTVSEFREEIANADAVILAKVLKILRRKDGPLADQDATVEIIKVYKGNLPENNPCIRMEIHQAMERLPGVKLAQIGDELILPIEFVKPLVGALPREGQKHHYMVPFYYVVENSKTITSAFGFPEEMQKHATLTKIESLIMDEVNRPQPAVPNFKLGDTLLTDNFDDGSLAGWTFLVGERGFTSKPIKQQFDVLWLGPKSKLVNNLGFKGEPAETTLKEDPKTGLFQGRHNNTVIEFGVTDGRLRLRSSHIWRHLTVVTGDPEWNNYQIEVDAYNLIDIEQPHARANYQKFGPYGRTHIPNFPRTQGEHSFLAIEFGNFANYDVSEETFGNQAFQIRCKYPEPPLVWRDHSRMLRLTKILDYQPWPIPAKKKIHITAQYYKNYVAGFIDGKKIVESRIPDNHPGIRDGRIALWAFETWVEFDNLKVTQLIPMININKPVTR